MKQNRIIKQLSQGRKQGYYKIKAKQLKMKALYETIMIDFWNEQQYNKRKGKGKNYE